MGRCPVLFCHTASDDRSRTSIVTSIVARSFPGLSVNVDQAQADACGHSLRSVHGIELFVYVFDMEINGVFADAQNSRNIP